MSPSLLYGTLEDLVDNITSGLTGDLEKVRVVFVWLASTNIAALRYSIPEPQSPLDYLIKIEDYELSHSVFFDMLCR